MEKIFYCYSKPLRDFLVEHGEKHFSKGIHEKTNKKFWMFYGTEKLNQLKDQWRSMK